jgi:hypothetical protein
VKKQIKRFSPHQNAKVFAILMAASSLFLIIPMFLMTFFTTPSHDAQGNQLNMNYFIFAVFPVFYLVFGYISIAVGCWVYNLLAKKIGGFEYEAEDTNEAV